MNRLNPRKYALTAGISLMVMAFAALFSYGLVLGSLEVEGDALATFENIKSSIPLFQAGIIGWLITLLTDILVAWCLYKFLKPINIRLSMLGAWLRLIYAALLGIAILNLIFILVLNNNTELPSLTINQRQLLVLLFLKAFHLIWSFGLIIFGGHLLMVGWLSFISGFVPKVISILLLIGSVGYIVIHVNFTFLPQFNEITKVVESILSVPMFLGEFSFGIWLIVKGGKVVKSADY